MIGSKTIAIVGGGIFGVTAAVHLADEGHEVHLFEKHGDILQCASGINQYRLHRGYHYPRSEETAFASKTADASFRSVYGDALLNGIDHYYGVSRVDSYVSGDQFLEFCRRLGLDYEPEWPEYVQREALEVCVKVDEDTIDPARLRSLCWDHLQASGVNVHLEKLVRATDLADHAYVIVAAYASTNEVVGSNRPYQFEVAEAPVVRVPTMLRNQSFVVMDGPFMCIDPFGDTGYSVLGNVVETNVWVNIGLHPEVPEQFRPFLDQGIFEEGPGPDFNRFINSASSHFRGLDEVEHLGSMFTVRAVLPGVERTDARPTLVDRVDKRLVVLFSGKIGTCVDAAREVVLMVSGG